MRFFDELLDRNRQNYTDADGNRIEIVEGREERVLRFNGIVYSRLNQKNIYTNEYWDYFLPLPSLWENPRVLMIGLGGGTIAFQLDRIFGKRVKLDIVEVNRTMVEMMGKFLPDDLKPNIIIGDGYEHVRGSQNQYDLIILDAYVDSLVPRQFMEGRFVDAAYRALGPSGILAMNYINSSNGSDNLERYVSLMKPRFKVYELRTLGFTMNTIIISSKRFDRDGIVSAIWRGMPHGKENKHVFVGYEQMFGI